MNRPSFSIRFLAALLFLVAIPSTTQAQISVRSQLSHDQTVEPGESYVGTITVRNDTEKVQQAKIYQSDYSFQSDGTNFFGEAGQMARSNANWVNIGATTLMVPPGESIEVPYEVRVPETIEGEAPNGSYWSMIMVEGVPENSFENLNNNEKPEGLGIVQVTRYGVQIASHIAGTGAPALAIRESSLSKSEENEAFLRIAVANEGDRFVQPEIWIELYSADGTPVGRKDGVNNRMYPGTSVSQSITLGELEPGNYRALVILDAGGDDVFGAEYTLNID